MKKKLLTNMLATGLVTTLLISGCGVSINHETANREETQEQESTNGDAETTQNPKVKSEDTDLEVENSKIDTDTKAEENGNDAQAEEIKLVDLKDHLHFIYHGNNKVDSVTGVDANTMVISLEGKKLCEIVVIEREDTEEGYNKIIAANHKQEDKNGNVYYSADVKGKKTSYIAFEDGTIVSFNYKSKNVYNNIECYKE